MTASFVGKHGHKHPPASQGALITVETGMTNWALRNKARLSQARGRGLWKFCLTVSLSRVTVWAQGSWGCLSPRHMGWGMGELTGSQERGTERVWKLQKIAVQSSQTPVTPD
jgi:hypothetical protein